MQLYKAETILTARFLEKQIEKAKEKEPEKVCVSCDFEVFFDCKKVPTLSLHRIQSTLGYSIKHIEIPCYLVNNNPGIVLKSTLPFFFMLSHTHQPKMVSECNTLLKWN